MILQQLSKETDERHCWWTGTARHGWRVFFALRDEDPSIIGEIEEMFISACRIVYDELNPDERDFIRVLFHSRRTPEQVAIDYAVPVTQIYRLQNLAQKRVAQELNLIKKY